MAGRCSANVPYHNLQSLYMCVLCMCMLVYYNEWQCVALASLTLDVLEWVAVCGVSVIAIRRTRMSGSMWTVSIIDIRRTRMSFSIGKCDQRLSIHGHINVAIENHWLLDSISCDRKFKLLLFSLFEHTPPRCVIFPARNANSGAV